MIGGIEQHWQRGWKGHFWPTVILANRGVGGWCGGCIGFGCGWSSQAVACVDATLMVTSPVFWTDQGYSLAEWRPGASFCWPCPCPCWWRQRLGFAVGLGVGLLALGPSVSLGMGSKVWFLVGLSIEFLVELAIRPWVRFFGTCGQILGGTSNGFGSPTGGRRG